MFTTPDGEQYNPDFQMVAKAFGIAAAKKRGVYSGRKPGTTSSRWRIKF